MDNKVKSILSVAIILAAGSLAVLFTVADFTNDSPKINQGIAIDRGNFDVSWYADNSVDRTVRSSLEMHVSEGSIAVEWEKGAIVSVDGIKNDDQHRWGLWVVDKGSNEYRKLGDDYDVRVSDYAACTVSYTETDSKPVPVVDYLGNSVFGNAGVSRVASLSSSVTEIVSALGAVDTIVGSDSASDYPKEFNSRKADGKIQIVGDMMSLSFEKIVSIDPDVAIFDTSISNSVEVAKQLQNTSIASAVLFPGNTTEVIMDNIFIVGTSLGPEYKEKTKELLQSLQESFKVLKEKVSAHPGIKKTGIVVMYDNYGAVPEDWVAGKDTCVRDYIVKMNGVNGFDSLVVGSWSKINKEIVSPENINPDFVIFISSTYKGNDGLNDIIKAHPEWAQTNAFKNNDVYLLYDQANNITSRVGPRLMECTEIFAKIMYPELFNGYSLPKYLGDNYIDYLQYAKVIFR